MSGRYTATKTYGHERGLSTAFRQWRADSHCSKLHGYALSFTFTFGCEKRDANGWVVDFGGLDRLQQKLRYWFDHTTVVAKDDPLLDLYRHMLENRLINLRVMEHTGCEAFAAFAAGVANEALRSEGWRDRVHVVSVEVREHGANSAIFYPEAQ